MTGEDRDARFDDDDAAGSARFAASEFAFTKEQCALLLDIDAVGDAKRPRPLTAWTCQGSLLDVGQFLELVHCLIADPWTTVALLATDPALFRLPHGVVPTLSRSMQEARAQEDPAVAFLPHAAVLVLATAYGVLASRDERSTDVAPLLLADSLEDLVPPETLLADALAAAPVRAETSERAIAEIAGNAAREDIDTDTYAAMRGRWN